MRVSIDRLAGLLAPALAVALAACGGSAASSPSVAASGSAAALAVTPPSGSAWDQLVAAAKKEGKVSVVEPPGNTYRNVLETFQSKFGIAPDILVGNGMTDVVPRISNERSAGQYNWDASILSPNSNVQGFKVAKALDPLKPMIVLPEILADASWHGGFDAGWLDNEKTYVYEFNSQVLYTLWINRDVVPQTQLSKLDQLWDPKWKGKIAMQDARLPGAGSLMVATWMVTKGPDKTAALLREQQPVLTQDRRQLAEWIIRGTYPLAVGLAPSELVDAGSQGVPVKQVQPLKDDDPGATVVNGVNGSIGVFNKAPHPNAAKLLLNWLLSQEGQAVWAKETNINSRRADLAPADPSSAIDPKRTYVEFDSEAKYQSRLDALKLAKTALG